ncbi:hypothetical protein [Fodinicola feengrottensis]|uniref:hypothetical protein n=1 Tax=Fodinicola feengrottensis TaxID=435914 RepID=UPI002441AF8F|nr:hypothetical protein [Fodinicola feengrottensis]
MQASMTAIAQELGGRFMINPSRHLHRIISPHPLGGVPMGSNPDQGVWWTRTARRTGIPAFSWWMAR